jgi:hypothetical protein
LYRSGRWGALICRAPRGWRAKLPGVEVIPLVRVIGRHPRDTQNRQGGERARMLPGIALC